MPAAAFRACLYRRGTTVAALSARGANGFAPFPGPGERVAESTKTMNSMIPKALNAMRICVCREPTASKTLSGERTINLSFLGNSATRSAALALRPLSRRPRREGRLVACQASRVGRRPRISSAVGGFAAPSTPASPRKKGSNRSSTPSTRNAKPARRSFEVKGMRAGSFCLTSMMTPAIPAGSPEEFDSGRIQRCLFLYWEASRP